MDQLHATILANAKKEAAKEGCKMYVSKTPEGFLGVTDARPDQGKILYEVYPGGRVVDWSSTYMG